MDYEKILHDYVGPISALGGWIFNSLWGYIHRRYFGKLTFYFGQDSLEISKYESTNKVTAQTIKDATMGKYSVWADIYNSKEIPISLREIKVKIGSHLSDEKILCREGVLNSYPYLQVINIAPNKFLRYLFEIKLNHDELQQIFIKNEKVFLTAQIHDGSNIISEIHMEEMKNKYKYR